MFLSLLFVPKDKQLHFSTYDSMGFSTWRFWPLWFHFVGLGYGNPMKLTTGSKGNFVGFWCKIREGVHFVGYS